MRVVTPKNPKKIPVKDARHVAETYGYQQVVIIARKHGDGAVEHVTTYGVDADNCKVAAMMGNTLKRAMGWPEELCNAKPKEKK